MKFLFVLNGETDNRGCEAILLSTLKILEEAFPGSKFINSSFRDDRASKIDYLQRGNLRHACHPRLLSFDGLRWQFAKRIQGHFFNFEQYLSWADMVLSLGGDNYSMDYDSASIYLDANEKILSSGKKLVIWGASIGPFNKDPEIEMRVVKQLKRAFKIIVRESISQSYLAGLGITENVVLMPDPAFSLDVAPVELPESIENILDAGAIGLNLSPLLARYRSSPGRWDDEAADWVEALLKATDSPVLLIPHVVIPGNDDAEFMADVMRRVENSNARLQMLDSSKLSSCNLKYVISRLRCFIGARTHATIAALSTGVPTLSIGYSVKAKGINCDIFGSDVWVLDHLLTDKNQLVSSVLNLLEHEVDVRLHLKSINKNYKMNPLEVRKALM